jgi:prepilin-type N-terminal cleavage/methylation domain-containing protein
VLRPSATTNRGGYSLVEFLVVMALMGLLVTPITLFLIRGLTSYQYLQEQSDTSVDLSTLSERIAKVVRGTTGILTAQANTLSMYGYFSPQDTVVKKIRYFISGNNLEIGVTPPTGTAPNYTYNSANEVVTIVRVDLSMGSTPMFTYYDDTGNALASGFAVGQIKEIGIYVAANPNTKFQNVPLSVTTRVTLRNYKTNL